jgi:transketolase N-terminal domain/subunit
MNRDKLRRYALRIVAAGALGAGLVVGVGVANAETTDTGTTTYIKVVNPAPFTAQESTWE